MKCHLSGGIYLEIFMICTPKYNHAKEKERFKSLIFESLDYLHEFAEMKPRTQNNISWKLCAAHYMAICEGENGNIEGVKRFLNYASNISSPNKKINIIPLTSYDLSIEKEMIEKIIKDDKQIGYGFCDDDNLSSLEERKIIDSLKFLEKYSPDIYNEIDTYIDTIYLTQEGENNQRFMRSGTNFYMWGMMFIYVHNTHTLPYYMEILTHECAHTALNLLNSQDEIVINEEDELFDAPFRKDARPMIGIFHAYFVLSRICYMFTTIKENYSGQMLEEIESKLMLSKRKLVETYNIVEKNAKLTPLGLSIHEDIKKLWDF